MGVHYEKPVVTSVEGFSEGVFAASGAVNTTGDNGLGCDSKYMKGVYQHPDYSNWKAGETRSYKKQFGCLGCPAFTEIDCGLQSHYLDANKADSYHVDDGNRMPSWERKGHNPDDDVVDWSM